ncbi:MAG: type II secretion system protein GspK, partial [Pseudomonadota bacterium]
AYRTSSQTLASIDELRSIQGYTLDVFARIAPVVCALPAAAANQNRTLNINTLEPQHAVLLQQAFGEALSLEDARTLIETRPQGGWVDVASLLEDPVIERIDPGLIQADQLGVISTLVEVSANVSYRGQDMTMRYLFEADPGRPIRTLRRERIG